MRIISSRIECLSFSFLHSHSFKHFSYYPRLCYYYYCYEYYDHMEKFEDFFVHKKMSSSNAKQSISISYTHICMLDFFYFVVVLVSFSFWSTTTTTKKNEIRNEKKLSFDDADLCVCVWNTQDKCNILKIVK